jgi:hypothetical protein
MLALSSLSLHTVLLPGAAAQPSAAPRAPAEAPPPGYADLADLVLAAPVVADATIRSTAKIKAAEAPGVAAGKQRLYVEADVTALVRGAGGTPPRIGYLIDVAPDFAGRLPRLKKARVLVLARPVPATPGQLQLVAPDAQLAWSPALDAQVRAIVQAAVATDAPPPVIGIGNAFHVPGALPGEGETQIFVATSNDSPMSLSILRRPGEDPRWAVALSEVVDEAAAPPPRDTLLWYRLACGLPATLPDRATSTLGPQDKAQAETDYAFVLAQLGPCGRTRGISGGNAAASISGGGAAASISAGGAPG